MSSYQSTWEKKCLSMAPSTPVALVRIQTPSFSICHGPNIDLYVTRTWNQWKQHRKHPMNGIFILCLNFSPLVLYSVSHSFQQQQYWLQSESNVRTPRTEHSKSEWEIIFFRSGTLEIFLKGCLAFPSCIQGMMENKYICIYTLIKKKNILQEKELMMIKVDLYHRKVPRGVHLILGSEIKHLYKVSQEQLLFTAKKIVLISQIFLVHL